MQKVKNLILIGENGYSSTRYLLEKMISLMDQGKKVLLITNDYPVKHAKSQFFDIILKDKTELQIKVQVNKRYLIKPNSEAASLISEFYKDRFYVYNPSLRRLNALLNSISGELTDFNADYIIIDNLYSVMKRTGYENRDIGIRYFMKYAIEYFGGINCIVSVSHIDDENELLENADIQHIKDLESIIHTYPWLEVKTDDKSRNQ